MMSLSIDEIIFRKLMVRAAELQQLTYDRMFIKQTEEIIRFPDFTKLDGWVVYIDDTIRDMWHHLNDMNKLLAYVIALQFSLENRSIETK